METHRRQSLNFVHSLSGWRRVGDDRYTVERATLNRFAIVVGLSPAARAERVLSTTGPTGLPLDVPRYVARRDHPSVTGPMIFISYAKEDTDYAQALYAAMMDVGLDPWMDKPPPPYQAKGLLVGQRWRVAIENAIRGADQIILVLSRQSVSKRGYVANEFRTALELMSYIPDDQVLVLPTRIDDCQVPNLQVQTIRLTDLQWEDVPLANVPAYAKALATQFGVVA